jgi:hypothetical protein
MQVDMRSKAHRVAQGHAVAEDYIQLLRWRFAARLMSPESMLDGVSPQPKRYSKDRIKKSQGVRQR